MMAKFLPKIFLDFAIASILDIPSNVAYFKAYFKGKESCKVRLLFAIKCLT